MPDFLTRNDGLNRPLREAQKIALQWLADNWNKYRVFCINGPVGSGKSLLARSIQREVTGTIITPSNILLDQYVSTYSINAVKGRDFYTSPVGLSCSDSCPITIKAKACPGCPYKSSRDRALTGEDTIFNPASFYYFYAGHKNRVVTIHDESHTLPGFLQQMATMAFDKRSNWKTAVTSDFEFVKWLEGLIEKRHRLAKLYLSKGEHESLKKILRDIDRCTVLLEAFKENPHNYSLSVVPKVIRGRKQEVLNVQPMFAPKFLRDIMVGNSASPMKVVLMSGTLFEPDIKELIGDEQYAYIELPNPIPAKQRPIYHRPIASVINYQTPPEQIAKAVEKVVADHPGQNCLVHTTYHDAPRIAKALSIPAVVNDKTNKKDTLKQFINNGGVFIAAGCAEGIDLYDDLCRVIYIPRMLKPNIGDPTVKKRLALPDGRDWYDFTTLKNTIQQLGRGVRHEKDFCIGIVGDPQFSVLINKYYNKLSKSFLESIVWV